MTKTDKCQRCDGCGKIANTEDGEPWTVWTNLPFRSAGPVLAGFVRPIQCPDCKGSGKRTDAPRES